MAITTQDGLIAAMAEGRTIQFYKASLAGSTGSMVSLFQTAGMPGAAAVPGTAAGQTRDRTSTGAMPIPAPSAVSYITSYEAIGGGQESIVLADRLVETGALVGNVITAQTVNSVALPARATNALDVELWLEIHTALGATASASVTASYTNQAGTAGRTATLIGGFTTSQQIVRKTYQMALQAGDTGVQSVQSVTLGTSTGTAGNFGVILRRSLLVGNVVSLNASFSQGYAETDLQICPDDACLELVVALGSSASTGNIMGNFGIAQG